MNRGRVPRPCRAFRAPAVPSSRVLECAPPSRGAVQIAKHLGAHVGATALAKDVPYVEALGANEIIDTGKEAFETVVRDVDGVLDTVGGDFAMKSYDVIRRGGTLVSMTAEPDDTRMREKGITAISQFTQPTTDRLTKLAQLVAEGIVTPRVSCTFSNRRVEGEETGEEPRGQEREDPPHAARPDASCPPRAVAERGYDRRPLTARPLRCPDLRAGTARVERPPAPEHEGTNESHAT